MNDFAGVVDEKTRLQLETLLENVKQKTESRFDIATVESTSGQDIFEFSRQLSLEWGVGARTSRKKSLLLVVSVNDKSSFTQFSKICSRPTSGRRAVGEMGPRMRAPVEAGNFRRGPQRGRAMVRQTRSRKTRCSAERFQQPALGSINRTTPPATDNASGHVDTPATSATVEAPRAELERLQYPGELATPKFCNREAQFQPDREGPRESAMTKTNRKVERTLTLPLEARAVKLRAFVDDHPDSRSKARAPGTSGQRSCGYW